MLPLSFIIRKDKIITNNLVEQEEYPFGGGTLGGVNVVPIAFILIDGNNHKMIRVEPEDTLFDKMLDIVVAFLKKSNNREIVKK